jgi:hypothetical protein
MGCASAMIVESVLRQGRSWLSWVSGPIPIALRSTTLFDRDTGAAATFAVMPFAPEFQYLF